MATDIQKWLEEQSAALGLDENEKAAAKKLIESPKFRGDFVALPDFHSALDRQRQKYESTISEAAEFNRQWQEEYQNTYAPAVDVVNKLRERGVDVSGLLNDGRGGVMDREGVTLTKADIAQMIKQAVEPVLTTVEQTRAGTIDYSTFVAEKAVEYRDSYNKRFPTSKFREFAFANRDKFNSLDSAYDAFTEEDRKVKDEADKEAWRAAEREKIRLEVQSASTLPESAGVEGSPFFIAAEQKDDVSRDQNRQEFAKKFAGIGKINE